MKNYQKLFATTMLCTGLALSAFAANVPDGTALAAEQKMTYRVLDEFDALDPQLIEGVDSSSVARDLFEGLYNQDAEGNLTPGVALSHDVSEDGMTYTFNLRDNAKWSDGTPVTAGDFVYAWQRSADPELASPYAWFVDLMSIENASEIIAGEKPITDLGVTAIDDHTLEVKLSQPLPYFAQMVTHTTTFPAPKWAIEEHGAAWTQPGNMVSNGAYVLSEHVPKERLVRVRNENYWDNEHTVLDEVTSLVVPDVNTAVTRFKAGEFDLVDEVPNGQFPSMKEDMPNQVFAVPYLCSYYYAINLTDSGNEALLNKDVRQALSLALDRDVIVNNVLQAGQYPAYSFTPASTANFTMPDIPAAAMTQEERLAKAKELMTAAGYGEGGKPLSMTLLYNTSESHKQIAVVVSQMWKQAFGAEVTLENQEWQVYLDKRNAQDFEITRAGWCGDYNEASTFLDLLTTSSGQNDMKYSNARVDELMAASKTMMDPNANYTEVEQIIADELPLIPIYHYSNNIIINEKLHGWPMENVQQNWYSKDLYFVE